MLNFRSVKSYSSFRAAVERELWLKQNVLTKQKELCHASRSQVWVSNIFPDAENHGLQSAKRLNNSCSLTEHCETCREERLNAFMCLGFIRLGKNLRQLLVTKYNTNPSARSLQLSHPCRDTTHASAPGRPGRPECEALFINVTNNMWLFQSEATESVSSVKSTSQARGLIHLC